MSQCGFKVEFGRGWIYCQRDANPPHHVHRFEFSMGEDEVAAPASPGPEPRAMEEIERLVEDFVGYGVEAEEEDHDYASSLEDLKTAKAALFLAIRRALGSASPGERRECYQQGWLDHLFAVREAWRGVVFHDEPTADGMERHTRLTGMTRERWQRIVALNDELAPAAPPESSGVEKEEP